MRMHDALFEASRDPTNLGVRRPTWNDESWMALVKGRPLMMIGGRPSPNCHPHREETAADDWVVFRRT